MSRSPSKRAAAAPAPAARPGAPPDLPTLSVSGDFVQKVMVVPTTTSSMLLGTGYIEETRRNVLVPYVEVKIAGIAQGRMGPDLTEDDYESLFSHVMPLDNALFMAWDLVRDVRIGCSQFRGLSRGSAAIEEMRLRHARQFAERLQTQAELCVAILDELIADAAPAPTEPAAESEAPRTGDAAPGTPLRKPVRRKLPARSKA